MTLWAIKGCRGFLKGNGEARYLQWRAHAYSGGLYKTKKSAENIINKVKKRPDSVPVELFEVEIILHGTVQDIIERELL